MPVPPIDFTQIDFPSDHLTLKELRRKFPAFFDHPPTDNSYPWRRPTRQEDNNLESLLGGTLNAERELAARTYYAKLGQQQQLPDGRQGTGMQDEAAECLIADYINYFGLARGEHEAREMIRHIEAQAAAQAERHLGQIR